MLVVKALRFADGISGHATSASKPGVLLRVKRYRPALRHGDFHR